MTAALKSLLKLKLSHRRLLRKLKKSPGYAESADEQMNWAVNKLTAESADHLISILNDDRTAWHSGFETAAEVIVSAAYSSSPERAYRAIHDHYEYALAISGQDIPLALRTTIESFREFHLNAKQERALIRLEASRIKVERNLNRQASSPQRYRYSSDVRVVVARQPEKVEQVIAVAQANPSVRAAELESILDGTTITPLSGGAL
jgi:hypothetical protein